MKENQSKPLEAYRSGQLNAHIYANFRNSFEQFWKSERWFFESRTDWQGLSMLDVGGAAGGLGRALMHHFDIVFPYCCIDVDEQAVAKGRQRNESFEFILGSFPEAVKDLDRKWDYVVMLAWFAQVTEWKDLLQSLCDKANRFVNVALNVRLDGTTVTDPDVSYVYYLDSGIRVPEVTHNLYELLNFCSRHEIKARKISFYGYTSTKDSSAFRPLPRREQIQGNLLIEKFSASDNDGTGAMSSRMVGGISNEVADFLGTNIESGSNKPEYEIVIDGETISV